MEQASEQIESKVEGGHNVDETNRQWLINQIRRVLDIALNRVTNPKTPASDRIKWSRIVITAGQACNSVLRDAEIDELKRQIEELKRLTEERLTDEQNSDQKPDRTTEGDA